MSYLPRWQEQRLLSLLKRFPVVCLTGPRQAGKSTLLKHCLRSGWDYLTLDQRGLLETAVRDPDLFVRDLKTPAVIDEAQKAPSLFHAIKAEVDAHPSKRFILSGSANFLLMKNISETLAGRTAVLELWPFSVGEMEEVKEPTFLEKLLKTGNPGQLQRLLREIPLKPLHSLYSRILWGGMPKIQEFSGPEEKRDWFEAYRSTYLEKDLRNLAQVGDLDDFQRFYQSIAFQTGNRLNLSHLAGDIGISVPTGKRYLDILRTSYQAFTIPSYHANISKRLIKTPKVYFGDTGLACFFLRYDSEEALKNSGRLGPLFETWIFNEVRKVLSVMPSPPALHYWQPQAGSEVDLLIEAGETLYPMEIKHAVGLQASDTKGLTQLMRELKKKTIPFGVIWYRGDRVRTVGPNILAVPFEYLWH